MKGSLEALKFLLKQGHQPQRSFFLAFGHDEEVSWCKMFYSDCILVFYGVINRNWNRFMILVGGGIEFCLYGMFCAPLEKIFKLEIFWDMIYSILGNIWVTLFCSKLMIDSVKKYLFSVVDHNSQSGWRNMVWQPAASFLLQPCLF